MPDLRLVLGAAVVGGVTWVLMNYPFEAWTVVGVIATIVGLLVARAGITKTGTPVKTRPVVDEPSMDAIPLAVFPKTKEIWAPPLAWMHWLIGGASGFGKSNALNAILVHLSQMPDVQIFAIDPKRGVEFWPWRARLSAIAKTKDESLAMLRFLHAELEHRMDTLRDRERQRKIGHGMGFPWLVLIIDEANEILHLDPNKERKAESLELIESMISMGRAAGLSIILCTQRPSAQSVPTGIRDNTQGPRVCFRCTTPQTTDMVLGQGAAAVVGDLKFLPKGVSMIWDDHTETYQKVKWPFIPDETIEYWAAQTAHLTIPAVIPPAGRTPPTTPQARRRGGRRRPARSSR